MRGGRGAPESRRLTFQEPACPSLTGRRPTRARLHTGPAGPSNILLPEKRRQDTAMWPDWTMRWKASLPVRGWGNPDARRMLPADRQRRIAERMRDEWTGIP